MKLLIVITLLAVTSLCAPQPSSSVTASANLYLQQMVTDAQNAIVDATVAGNGIRQAKTLAKDLDLSGLCESASAPIRNKAFSDCSNVIHLYQSFATALTEATPGIVNVSDTHIILPGDCSPAGSNSLTVISEYIAALVKCFKIEIDKDQAQLEPSLPATLKGACGIAWDSRGGRLN